MASLHICNNSDQPLEVAVLLLEKLVGSAGTAGPKSKIKPCDIDCLLFD